MPARPGFAVVAAGAFVAALGAGHALADDGGSPVIVAAQGPRAIRVELAGGGAMPCDSSANRMLYRGWLAPGEVLRLSSPSASVCFRQTYDNFPEVNWSTPRLLRPLPQCSAVRRRVGPCTEVADPSIRIEVRSGDPGG